MKPVRISNSSIFGKRGRVRSRSLALLAIGSALVDESYVNRWALSSRSNHLASSWCVSVAGAVLCLRDQSCIDGSELRIVL